MKKVIKRMSLVLVLALILFLISIPFVNNYDASKVSAKLKEIPLPENTEYLESISKAGKFVGNGNGMQYYGAILIKSELSSSELDNYYSDIDSEYSVEEQFGQNVRIGDLEELSFTTDVSGKGYYLVYTWGEGREPFSTIDLRGH